MLTVTPTPPTPTKQAPAQSAAEDLDRSCQVQRHPASRYKSNRDHVVPLSAAAQTVIAAMPDRGDHVFSVDGSRPLSGFNQRKIDFDAACGVTDWRLHNLRRTARTLLSKTTVKPEVAEMCLGHAMLTGVRRTYDRHDYFDAKREAFDTLARVIERIVHPADVVVPMPTKARRK